MRHLSCGQTGCMQWNIVLDELFHCLLQGHMFTLHLSPNNLKYVPFSEPPEVSMELSQQIFTWGQSAKFTCKVRGNPQPSVMWLRNAVPLFSSHRMQLSRRALRVSSVGPEDEGIYQCMAENEVGSAQAMIQLRTVRPGKSLVKLRGLCGNKYGNACSMFLSCCVAHKLDTGSEESYHNKFLAFNLLWAIRFSVEKVSGKISSALYLLLWLLNPHLQASLV